MTTYARGYTPTPDDIDWQKRLQEDLARMSPVEQPAPGADAEPATTADPAATSQASAATPAPTTVAPTAPPQPQVMTAAHPMSGPPPPPPPPPPAPAPPPAAPPLMTGSGVPQTMEMAGQPEAAEVAEAEDGGLSADLEAYARQWMDSPNRYLSDLVTSTRESGDLRRAEARNAGVANIDELVSSRGIVGSSVEADIRSDLERALAADVSAEERELLDNIASYEAQDRLAGGEFGLDVAQLGQSDQLAREQMEHEVKLQTSALTQRESEFARSMGLDERQFVAEQERFAQQFGEEVAGRLQQNDQFRATLEAEDARFAINSGLQERALDLQAQDMTMEDAFRQASLEQERELTLLSQELTRLGIEQDDAYRYAALTQDAHFREEANRLTEQGMELDDAFRNADLAFREANAARADKSTRLAILVQAMGAMAEWGGLGDDFDVEDLITTLMGEDPPPPDPDPDPDPDADPDAEVPDGSGGGYGPGGSMTLEEWRRYLRQNQGDPGPGVEE